MRFHNKHKTSPFQNPTKDFEMVVHKLSSLNESQGEKQLQNSERKLIFFKKAICHFFSGKSFELLFHEKKILDVVQVIRKYYPLIEKLKGGTEKEQKLAKYAIETIKKHNKRVECLRHMNFAKRAAHFMCKKLGIEKEKMRERKIALPVQATFSNTQEISSEPFFLFSKIPQFSNSEEDFHAPTKPEQDMFRMKAIMLLKEHNFSFPMIDTFSSKLTAKVSTDINVVSLRQLFKPLPGEEIELTGDFKRSKTHLKRSIPLIETFRLQAKSHQTGFPHPMQLSGFAFCNSLLPSCPLRPENLPFFYKMHKSKENAAIALLPKGRYNKSAKQTLLLKSKAFIERKEDFLFHHHKLAEGFLKFKKSASRKECKKVISTFFASANSSKDAYAFIASAYESFNTLFIKEAKQHLYETHILDLSSSKKGSTKEELSELFRVFIETKKKTLANSKTPSVKKDFILFLSSIFDEHILNLIFQEMSEIAFFPPPLLNEGDQIVQASLFQQLQSFLDELDTPPQSKQQANEFMERTLLNSILLFREEHQELPFAPLLNELEFYYLERQRERSLRTSHI